MEAYTEPGFVVPEVMQFRVALFKKKSTSSSRELGRYLAREELQGLSFIRFLGNPPLSARLVRRHTSLRWPF